MKKNLLILILLSAFAFMICGCAETQPEIKSYTVTWKNYDGKVLETDREVPYGQMPVFDGDTPQRDGNKQYSYTFDGWTPEVAAVSGDVTYTARFKSEIKSYTVTWKNYDGKVLETDREVPYGQMPVFDGDTPQRDGDEQYSYTFDGWTPEVAAVSGDVTYTARFTSELNVYELIVTSNDTSKGTASVTSGRGYYGESITVTATPNSDCVFKGWYRQSEKVSDEKVYTFVMPAESYSLIAHFSSASEEQEAWNIAHGVTPRISADGKTLTYGLYPQKRVTDTSLIDSLNVLTVTSSNGWYMFENEYYAKLNANPKEDGLVFEDGTVIVSGETYWFKCEVIEWNILCTKSGEYYLLSSVILDTRPYHNSPSSETIDGKVISANNYEYSDIRAWLNGDFFKSAFALNGAYVQTKTTYNGAESTGASSNEYACADTEDKVFLPSYSDLINPDYGFYSKNAKNDTRSCRLTDWARARGALYSTDKNGNYWTRSPYSARSYGVHYVGTDGMINSHVVSTTYIGVRPGVFVRI